MKSGKCFLLALLLLPATAAGQTDKLGVVFMHGKQGHPGQPQLAAFVRKIEGAGFAFPGHTEFLAHLAGVDEVWRVGGAQAVGALAYGTKTLPQ